VWVTTPIGNPIKMHANRELLTDVLKRGMGFDGFVISDWEAVHQLPGAWEDQVRAAVNAGVDMMMEPNAADTSGPDHSQRFETTLLDEVNAVRVSQARIDDAVSRILEKKFELGLFEQPYTDRTHIDEIGSRAHRRAARRAPRGRQVAGAAQEQAPRAAAPPPGPSSTWPARTRTASATRPAAGRSPGRATRRTRSPGTRSSDGIRDAIGYRGRVTYSKDASAPIRRRDIGVVVVGETPYAEGFGDVGGPRWGYDPGENGVLRPARTMMLNDSDKAAVDKVCAEAKKCVVVVVSGRPMIIEPAQLSQIEGLVAAWLPGSEGKGVADTLFGSRPFTGKLPMTWPRTLEQEPINVGDANYDPLYPFGFGLRTR
jgi:beta-glucosidase